MPTSRERELVTDPTRAAWTVNAGRLWAGGAAAALVAALIAVVGILLCRGILDVPLLAPKGQGTWGNANTVSYALGAAVAALLATGLMHALLLFTPRPHLFFSWVVSLSTLAAMLAPFAVSAHRDSQVATAVINLVLGVAIGSLVSGSARSAVSPMVAAPRPVRPLPPPYQRP
jgi:Family of unknown function (DUF6069)